MLVPILFAVVTHSAPAAVDMSEDEFRLYCGYLDEIGKPDYAKLSNDKRDKKIASKAKVKPAVLTAAVAKGGTYGATCDEIGKKAEADTKAALDAALPGRISIFKLDFSDPSHVVALVSWLGVDKKKVVEEASTIANAIATSAKITKTIAIRAVDPAAPDKEADSAMWWEAKITHSQATRIDKAKIADYAATRYLRLFDGCKTVIEDGCAAH
jgi:hypothetical protein